jgi:hypothetical protein
MQNKRKNVTTSEAGLKLISNSENIRILKIIITFGGPDNFCSLSVIFNVSGWPAGQVPHWYSLKDPHHPAISYLWMNRDPIHIDKTALSLLSFNYLDNLIETIKKRPSNGFSLFDQSTGQKKMDHYIQPDPWCGGESGIFHIIS